MKTKYMSRKFIVAVCGMGISLVALLLGNTPIAFAGLALGGMFIIGEAIIDEAKVVKKTITVNDNVSRETSIGESDDIKDKA